MGEVGTGVGGIGVDVGGGVVGVGVSSVAGGEGGVVGGGVYVEVGVGVGVGVGVSVGGVSAVSVVGLGEVRVEVGVVVAGPKKMITKAITPIIIKSKRGIHTGISPRWFTFLSFKSTGGQNDSICASN